MKSFLAGWIIFAALTLAMRPAAAYDGGASSQAEEPRPWESRPWTKSQDTRGWETRPWESASEEMRPDEARPGEERKPGYDRRRAGRKAIARPGD